MGTIIAFPRSAPAPAPRFATARRAVDIAVRAMRPVAVAGCAMALIAADRPFPF